MRGLPLLVFSLAVGAVGLGACDDDPEPEPSETPSEDPPPETTTEDPPPRVPEPTDDDPLRGLDEPALLENEPTDLPERPDFASLEVPANGCVAWSDRAQRLWPRPGPTAIVAAGDDGFAFAGYSAGANGGEEIFVGTIRPGGAPRPVFRDDLERPFTAARVAPPGLGNLDLGHVGVATTDMASNVRFAVVQLGGEVGAWREVGSGADRRFAPAVGMRGDRHVVAYTEGRGEEGMGVWAVTLDPRGEVTGRHDLTPANMSAASPMFVPGADELLFVDPREGLSVLLASDVSTDRPPPASTVRPLNHLFEPANVAPVPFGGGRWAIGFVAMGQAAATAVGLSWVEGDVRPGPIAIVPSEGNYGALHVSGARLGERAVFVADHAKAPERDAPRDLHVRLARPEGGAWQLGDPLTLTAPDGTGRWGHAAADEEGTVAVTMMGADGVYLHWLRCDAGDAAEPE